MGGLHFYCWGNDTYLECIELFQQLLGFRSRDGSFDRWSIGFTQLSRECSTHCKKKKRVMHIIDPDWRIRVTQVMLMNTYPSVANYAVGPRAEQQQRSTSSATSSNDPIKNQSNTIFTLNQAIYSHEIVPKLSHTELSAPVYQTTMRQKNTIGASAAKLLLSPRATDGMGFVCSTMAHPLPNRNRRRQREHFIGCPRALPKTGEWGAK